MTTARGRLRVQLDEPTVERMRSAGSRAPGTGTIMPTRRSTHSSSESVLSAERSSGVKKLAWCGAVLALVGCTRAEAPAGGRGDAEAAPVATVVVAPAPPSIVDAGVTPIDERPAIERALCEGFTPEKSACPCPSFMDRAGPDVLEIGAIHYGAFTAPVREEAVVALTGCITGAASSLTYGARALLRRGASGWRRVLVTSTALGACKPVEVAGVVRLLCEQHAGNMGLYSHTLAFLGYLGDREDLQEVLEVWTEEGAIPPSPLPRVVKVTRVALRSDALEVDVESEIVRVDKRSFPLRYALDGTRFVPTKETRSELAALAKRQPEH
jgi:hypothetical protein